MDIFFRRLVGRRDSDEWMKFGRDAVVADIVEERRGGIVVIMKKWSFSFSFSCDSRQQSKPGCGKWA
jgi:hypothetical protein